MLARLQRLWVLILGTLAFGGTAWLIALGLPWWVALPFGVLIFNLHAALLAFEFLWLSRVDPGEGIPSPSLQVLCAAWWGEIWTGLQVFCWRQPFLVNALQDRLLTPAAPRRAVLLVHGFVCNRGLWNPWMKQLAATDVPFVAVNLEPVFGSIDRYVTTLEQAVRRLETLGGPAPVIVAHSMGGLAVRAWLRDRAADHRVHSVITIGTPHRGTSLARLALTPNARQMRPNSPWLRALNADEPMSRRALFTCFFSHCDNIVFPAAGAALPGADNRHVAGIAHVHLAFHDSVFNEVLRRVDLTAGVDPAIDDPAISTPSYPARAAG